MTYTVEFLLFKYKALRSNPSSTPQKNPQKPSTLMWQPWTSWADLRLGGIQISPWSLSLPMLHTGASDLLRTALWPFPLLCWTLARGRPLPTTCRRKSMLPWLLLKPFRLFRLPHLQTCDPHSCPHTLFNVFSTPCPSISWDTVLFPLLGKPFHLSNLSCSFFLFGGSGVWTQGLTLARYALASHVPGLALNRNPPDLSLPSS
jgi:hypothetical protein